MKEAAFLDLILKAYRAEKVAIGPVNLPVTRLFVEEIILECRKKHITKVDILGFEFEMGLFPNVLDEARGKGIDIAPKYIPAEVFDKRAVEKNQVVFHDVSFIEVKPHVKKSKKGQPATGGGGADGFLGLLLAGQHRPGGGSTGQDEEGGQGFAWIGLSPPPEGAARTCRCGDSEEYAYRMFRFFRECDREGIGVICCEMPPPEGIGQALRDRLQRAAEGK